MVSLGSENTVEIEHGEAAGWESLRAVVLRGRPQSSV